jgi:O-antigen/teichoic acid export membrane protein
LIKAVFGFNGAFLNMCGYQKFYAVVATVAGISNVALNCLLIPLMGVEGAAIASLVTVLSINVVSSLYIRLREGYFIWLFGRTET